MAFKRNTWSWSARQSSLSTRMESVRLIINFIQRIKQTRVREGGGVWGDSPQKVVLDSRDGKDWWTPAVMGRLIWVPCAALPDLWFCPIFLMAGKIKAMMETTATSHLRSATPSWRDRVVMPLQFRRWRRGRGNSEPPISVLISHDESIKAVLWWFLAMPVE